MNKISIFFDNLLILKLIDKKNHSNKQIVDDTRALFLLWSVTTLVMWLYSFYCFFAFPDNKIVFIGGLIFTILHSLAPLIFYFSQSKEYTSLGISLTGVGFQSLFCIYSGGVFSPAAIWLTLHPVILGYFGGPFLLVFSVILNFIIVILLFLAGHFGLLPHDILPTFFKNSMIISSYIGLDILVAIFTITTVRLFSKKNTELLKSREQKENLLRILCHDLNNSLAIVILSAKMASKTAPSEVDKHLGYWKKVTMASSLQVDLINLVKEIEAAESGKAVIKLSIVNVRELLSVVEEIFSDKLIDKNIKIKIVYDSSEDIFVLAERVSLLNNVLNNIISNALKFSNSGDIILINVKKITNQVIIEIKDQGIGMPDHIKQNLFSKSYPTTRIGTNGEKGTGFGMVLMNTFMQIFKGTVEIESFEIQNHPLDHGTLFRLKFITK